MAKRRLPILDAKDSPRSASSSPSPLEPPLDPADERRPAWQWAFFGVVACFSAWLPLSWLAGKLLYVWSERAFGSSFPAAANDQVLVRWIFSLGHLSAMALGALAAGFIVGRFGAASNAGVREAAASGAMTGVLAIAIAAASGFSLAFLVVPVVAALAAAGGAALARRRRGAV